MGVAIFDVTQLSLVWTLSAKLLMIAAAKGYCEVQGILSLLKAAQIFTNWCQCRLSRQQLKATEHDYCLVNHSQPSTAGYEFPSQSQTTINSWM